MNPDWDNHLWKWFIKANPEVKDLAQTGDWTPSLAVLSQTHLIWCNITNQQTKKLFCIKYHTFLKVLSSLSKYFIDFLYNLRGKIPGMAGYGIHNPEYWIFIV